MLTPSSNTILEPTTIAMVAPLGNVIAAHLAILVEKAKQAGLSTLSDMLEDARQEAERSEGGTPREKPTGVDALLSPAEAARVLAISKKTLRAHAEDGTIPRVVIGRGTQRKRYGFDPVDIEMFKRSRKDFGAPSCPSSKGRGRKSTPTTSRPEVIGFLERRARRDAEKRKQSSPKR